MYVVRRISKEASVEQSRILFYVDSKALLQSSAAMVVREL